MLPLKELPFFFKSHPDSRNGGFPHVMPFHLYYDESLRMFRQKPYPELMELLDRIYKEGSLAEGSISNESGAVYVDQVTRYMVRHFDMKPESRILEVGYGSGIILKKLREITGAILTGVEPGNHVPVAGLENIRLVNDFFPTPAITGTFDLIYSLLVLEHVEDPVSFLNALKAHLHADGKVIIAVPNCESYLKDGDLSILIHEHFSYFTREALMAIAGRCGFYVENISVIEGALVCTCSLHPEPPAQPYERIPATVFTGHIEEHLQRISRLVSQYQPNEIAVYAPVRALNSLFLTGNTRCRLVDDSTELHGRYLPCMENPVESFEHIAGHPPKCILIFSRTFGEKIKLKCRADARLTGTTLLTLSDLNNEPIRL